MMNPAVVIATHQRIPITTENIRRLQEQSLRPSIVVVVSDPDEATYYTQLGGVSVVTEQNKPLGRKWQHGVNMARNLSASHVIICGSDDILAKGFIKSFCQPVVPFIGLKQWYIWDRTMLYLFDYLAKQPLGGGRVYSRALLEHYDWNLFDTHANRLLDDYGWEVAKNEPLGVVVDDGAFILAVKGNWPVLNPLPGTLISPNAKLLGKWMGVEAVSILMDKFGYV